MGNIASGDVKYHLGVSYDRPTRGGQKVPNMEFLS